MKTKMTFKQFSILLVLFFSLIKVQAQFSGTYSIGPTHELDSIQKAIDSLMLAGVSGPTTFEIDSGTYIEYVYMMPIAGTSETNRITFKAKNDSVNDVILPEFSFYGADYVTLKSLTIESNYSNCIRIQSGSDHITIDSCIIKGRNVNTNSRMYDAIYGPKNSIDSYTTIRNCKIYNGSNAIYLMGNKFSQGETGHIIESNEIIGSYVYNVGIVYAKSATIRNNIISSNSNTVHPNACGIIANISPNITIANNVINVHKHGIRMHNNQNKLDTSIVYNNMIASNYTGSAFQAYPLYLTNGNKNLKVLHNTFYNTNENCTGVINSEYNYYDANLLFQNNILVSASNQIARFATASNKYKFYNNNFYSTTDGWRLLLRSTWYDSLEESAEKISAYNYNIDPMFSSNTNLHVNNALLGNLGLSTGEILTDIDGDLRNDSTPDIGADEFDPLFDLDLAIIDFEFKDAPMCQVPDSVYGLVKNIGAIEITSFKVERTVNDEIIDTALWTGDIPSYDSVNFAIQYPDFNNGDTLAFRIISVNNTEYTNHLNNNFAINGVWLAQSQDFIIADSTDLRNAVDILNQRGICNDVQLILKTGVYNNTISLTEVKGVSEFAKITIKSESGNSEDVVLQPEFNASAVIEIEGTDYLTIKDLTINTDSSNADGIEFYGDATHNTYENLIIHSHLNGDNVGIYSSGDNDNNLTIRNCEIYNGSYGIEIEGKNGEDSVLIENNLISGKVRNVAFYCDYMKNIKINNNTIIIDSTFSATGVEVYDIYGRIEFTNNKVLIDSTDESGAYFEYFYSANAQKSLIANNVFNVGGKPYASVYMYETVNTNLFNNTIVVASPSESDYALYVDYGGSVNLLNNNIVANENATAIYFYNQPIALTSSDYNNIFSEAKSLIKIENKYLDSISSWQSYGWDQNSISVNPDFYNKYKTCKDSLNNAGYFLSGVPSTDIDGNPRNMELPDIGASEFDAFEPGLLGDDIMFCDESYRLDAGIGASNYLWNTGDTTRFITIDQPGIYSVNIEGMCGTAGADSIELLSAEIQAKFNIESDGYTVKMENESTGVIDSYLWTLNDFTSSNENELLELDNDGIYTVFFQVSNTCQSATLDTTICVEKFTMLSNEFLEDDFLLCDAATLNAGNKANTYLWNTGDTTQTIIVENAGEYFVKATSLCGVEVFDTIVAQSSEINASFDYIISDKKVGLINTSTGIIDSYTWTIGDYNAYAENEVFTFETNGNYTISLEVENICNSSKADTNLLIGTTSINEFLEYDINIFPNPATEKFAIVFENVNNLSISIYNLSGVELYQDLNYTSGKEINIEHLDSGMFLLKIMDNVGNVQVSHLVVN